MKKRLKRSSSDAAIVPEIVEGGTYSELVGAIGELLDRARERIATTANTTLVETYWNTGRYIVEYEQHGADRAKYGDALISRLARDLTIRHGRGFSKTNILYMRKLYLTFRKVRRCLTFCRGAITCSFSSLRMVLKLSSTARSASVRIGACEN